MNELRECPFCESKAVKLVRKESLFWIICCAACGTEGPLGKVKKTAIMKWNCALRKKEKKDETGLQKTSSGIKHKTRPFGKKLSSLIRENRKA
jgi:hypothetical protein